MIDLDWFNKHYSYNPETGKFSRSKYRRSVGTINSEGYLRIGINGSTFLAHRIAWFYIYGVQPDEIDHINGDRTDNRIANLRAVTREENMKNQRIYKNNKSGHIGVYWDKNAAKWRACIRLNKKLHNLGYFDDVEIAGECRELASRMCGFHENHGHKLTL